METGGLLRPWGNEVNQLSCPRNGLASREGVPRPGNQEEPNPLAGCCPGPRKIGLVWLAIVGHFVAREGGWMRIGVIANRTKAGALGFLKTLKDVSGQYGVELFWEEGTAKLLHLQGHTLEFLREKADLLLVAGGDGSILRVVQSIYPSQIPILGINIGGLGFLTAVTGDEIGAALTHIVAGKLRYSERLVLQTRVRAGGKESEIPCALNDLVAFRTTAHMARLRVFSGPFLVSDYEADGLIVATPTGSTAYALSAGGPIVLPEARVFTLNPICPHTLTNRTLVLSADSTLRIEVPPRCAPVRLEFDGHSGGVLHAGDWAEVGVAPHPVRLAFLAQRDFFGILRQKLGWRGTTLTSLALEEQAQPEAK